MKNQNSPLKAVTATLGIDTNLLGSANFSEKTNASILELISEIIDQTQDQDLLVLPGGILYFNEYDLNRIVETLEPLVDYLSHLSSDLTVVFGFDCEGSKDQMGVALDRSGIKALARKFHPTNKKEKELLHRAKHYNIEENGYTRIFSVKNRNFYISVCYDCFGPSHLKLKNPGVDGAVTLVHDFYKTSGYVDFARKGFAGLSKEWNIPVLGSAHFWDMKIPKRWPTGLFNSKPEQSTLYFKYSDNALSPYMTKSMTVGFGETCLNFFEI